MQHKITTYEYVKKPVKDTEIFIPEEPFYCFQTGIRRAIRIIPQKVTWDDDPRMKKGDVHGLEVTCVYGSFECKIEKFKICLSNLESLINTKKDNSLEAGIARMLLEEDYYERSESQFSCDLQNAIDEINDLN